MSCTPECAAILAAHDKERRRALAERDEARAKIGAGGWSWMDTYRPASGGSAHTYVRSPARGVWLWGCAAPSCPGGDEGYDHYFTTQEQALRRAEEHVRQFEPRRSIGLWSTRTSSSGVFAAAKAGGDVLYAARSRWWQR